MTENKTLEIDSKTYDRIEAYATANNVDVPKYLEKLLLSPNVEKNLEKTQSIEYESVTVKVPKIVMDFYRKIESNPIEALEYSIVDSARAQIEGMEGEEWIEIFGLKSVFHELLGDPRFKSEE